MKIYAVRDTLIGYYLQPFVAPADEKPVLAAIARQVNDLREANDIAQAPHHFEVWKLGEIYEDGSIQAEQTLICRCDSLIRPGIRRTGTEGPGEAAAGSPAIRSTTAPQPTSHDPGTSPSTLPTTPPREAQPRNSTHSESGGSHPNAYRQHSPDRLS